jgi:4-amino-4-deoxy-L-arabinose transferase-like glycosyltransferase
MQLDFLTDEGWWAHNARNRARFGGWIFDDHNPPLFQAPFYSAVLWCLYEIFGVGLVQTRWLAAVAGLVTCGVVFWTLRRLGYARAAWIAVCFLGLDYFAVSYARTGFGETFEGLFVVGMAAGIMLAEGGNRRWMVASGCSFALAILAKLSAAPLLLGPLLYAGICWFRDPGERRELLFRATCFAVGAAAVLFVLWLCCIRGHGDTVMAQLKMASLQAGSGGLLRTVASFGGFGLSAGWREELSAEVAGLTPFVLQAAVTILAVAVVAVASLTRASARDGSSARAELFLWCWLAGTWVAVASMHHIQPDRRYLPLMPPLVMIVGMGFRDGTLTVRLGEMASHRRVRGLAGLVIGFVLGIYLRPWLLDPIQGLFSSVAIGSSSGVGQQAGSLLAWFVIVAVSTLVLLVLGPLVPQRAVRVSLVVPVVFFALFGPVKVLSRWLWHPRYSMLAATERLASLTREFRPEERVVVGDWADPLGLGTELFPFIIRDWPHFAMQMNLDGWERFSPNLALTMTVESRPPVGGFERLPDLEICQNEAGETRFTIEVWKRIVPVVSTGGPFADGA